MHQNRNTTMKKIRSFCFYLFATIVCLLFSITCKSQNSITLSQAILNGLANKKNINSSKLDVTISQLQTKALYSKYLPQVSAEYTYLYNPILQTSILPIGVFNPSYPNDATKNIQFGTKWSQSAGLTAYMPLLDISISRHIHESKLQEKIAALSQQQTENDLVFNIATAYSNIYIQQSKIISAIADTIRTCESYVFQKNKFDEQRLLKSDLNKAKVNHNNAVQVFTDDIALIIEDKVYLLFLMGNKKVEDFNFELDPKFELNYQISEANNSSTGSAMPELQMFTAQSELRQLQVSSEKSKHTPTIGFKGYLGANQYSNSFNPIATNTWFGLSYVGLNIKMPILFGENQVNKIQQLRLQSKQFELQKADEESQYNQEILIAKLKLENVKKQLTIQQENIVLGKESFAILQARMMEGQESASTINIEEASLQVAVANYETNKKQAVQYWLDYLKATGQLSLLWK